MSTLLPLRHIVRIRRTEDLQFVRSGLMDELLVNANELENSPESTRTTLNLTGLPYSIDPMLVRFQFPNTLRNEKGDTKRNFRKLAAAYGQGLDIKLGSRPMSQLITDDASWRRLGANVVAFQKDRLVEKQTRFDLFELDQPSELRPVRVIAAALLAEVPSVDRINRLLVDSSAEEAGTPVAVPVIIPLERLRDRRGAQQLLTNVPSDGVQSYLIWTPSVTEATLLADPDLLEQLIWLVGGLANRGIAVGHLHAGYVVGALHELGVSAVVHHLGWLDRGEPADAGRGGLRSCRTYVTGLRHAALFETAQALGRGLSGLEYSRRFCGCEFCSGAFANAQHPLDLLLEEEFIPFRNGRGRHTPTSRAVGSNTWHFLLSRRMEMVRFSTRRSVDVLKEDIEQAAALAGRDETYGLTRLADILGVA